MYNNIIMFKCSIILFNVSTYISSYYYISSTFMLRYGLNLKNKQKNKEQA